MKSESWRQRTAGILAPVILLTACGGTATKDEAPVAEVTVPGDYFVGTQNVYAQLELGSGGSWVFTKVSRSEMPPAKGYLVRLNDLTPVFDIRVAECTPQNYPSNHKCNPTHPFREKDVGVMRKIINGGIAAGTAGKVTDVSRTYETTFDEAKFNQAVDEALVNTGLNENRHDFINALETYSALLADSRAKLADLERKAKAEYADVGSIQLEIQPELSGLTEYYYNDIAFDDLIELSAGPLKIAGKKKLSEDALLPCDAHRCVQKARSAINTLRADLEQAQARLVSTFDPLTVAYNVSCDQTTYEDYLLDVSCPAEIVRQDGRPTPLPLKVRILARDFDRLFPAVNIADDNLGVRISEGAVVFENRSRNYLSVTAQTVYYNAEVRTTPSTINIAPGESISRPIGDFVSEPIEIESSFKQMTPNKAAGTSFEFGFAAAYRAAGDVVDTTLYDMRSFNLGCVIENRSNADTCFDTQSPEAQARGHDQSLPHVPN